MSIAALQDYLSDDDNDDEGDATAVKTVFGGSKIGRSDLSEGEKTAVPSMALAVNAAPEIVAKEDIGGLLAVDRTVKELTFNPKYEALFAPEVGPANPFKTEQERATKNTLSGFVEHAEFNDFQFEAQRRTFHSFGYARDPSANDPTGGQLLGDVRTATAVNETTVFESTKKLRKGEKRKTNRNYDAADVEGYTGPWAPYVDQELVAKPDDDTLAQMEEYRRKKKRLTKVTRDDTHDEKSILHVKDAYDYQNRSFLHAPQDVGVNLRSDEPPDKCFIPKKLVHTWQGHTKGVQAIRWFPKTAHLLLSCSMDSKIKIWEVYKGRRCIRTYAGHKQAVRDICFSNDGSQFLSASYDRHVKLWDTETGTCKMRFTTGKVPYCVKYNPDDDKQHFFLAGMSDKKIVQFDIRSGEIAQEYDRHMGAVNTVTFFDNNRRFCSTSDDKSMRIWEWEIPVDTKLIQDPSMHSMPSVTLSPNQRWLACQSMDNKVRVFQVIDDKMRFNHKKQFRGHMVAGYACAVDFAPDMSMLISGDADGKVFVWEWKTHRIMARWRAHDGVCIGALWHPHETSKVATCGWDGVIKFWD